MTTQSPTELLLRASCEDIEASLLRLTQVSKGTAEKKRGYGVLEKHFWLEMGALESAPPKSESELEVERHTDAERFRYARLMGTFSGYLNDLDQILHDEALKIGSHREGEVVPNAPSRCPDGSGGEFQLNELQRAAQRFFYPNCPPPMRRIMVELTPGMGKTCVYMEVIAKFLGKRNPETGDFFDIVVLGDDEVFSALDKDVKNCPARVDLDEIVKWNMDVNQTFKNGEEYQLTRRVLYKRDEPDADLPPGLAQDKKYISIKNVNSTLAGKCRLNTEMEPPTRTQAAPKSKTKAKAKAKTDKPAKAKGERPLQEKKSPEQCGDDALIWRGSRVIMIPYAVAAKWVVSTKHGLPLLSALGGDRIGSKDVAGAYVEFPKADVHDAFRDKATAENFHKDFGKFFTAAELGTGPQGLIGSQFTSGNGVYDLKNLKFSSSNTLFIIDEVQSLATPSKWGKGHHTKPFSPALSEALWRCTGDFCNEKTDPECKVGRQKTPYIFAGTATPNTGTNPESTICLLQILNGKQRPHLFVPRWEDSEGTENDPRTLQEYRRLLKDSKNRSSKILHWPAYAERKAKNLVVFPRTFLDAESGFVKDVTKGGKDSGPFPLLAPRVQAGRVVEWTYDKQKYTYASAAQRVISERLLPDESRDVSDKGAYLEDAVKNTGKPLMHDLAYKSFICAARDEDLRFQYTRIYKPVYEDELNRHFLQDMVATRVFTANSYFDYRLYPQVDPTYLQELSRPLTRLVIPKQALRCLPRCMPPDSSKKEKKSAFCKGVFESSSEKTTPSAFVPDLESAKNMKLTPRMRAEASYPSAKVRSDGVVHLQYPWYVPPDSAETFLKHLTKKDDPKGDFKDCRWSEWSLCADLEEMKDVCEKLFLGYVRSPHDVDVALEDRLRDFCARNCPKLVVAADDMYAHPPSKSGVDSQLNLFAPGLASESKSFFFMNATNRAKLNSNYFIVLASFYFRMRCRPYLQKLFEGHEDMLPVEYRKENGATVQHRIAWLDALLLRGGDYSWMKTREAVENAYLQQFPRTSSQRQGKKPDLNRMADWADVKKKLHFPDWGEGSSFRKETLQPPWNVHGVANDKTLPDASQWFAFWSTWLKGYGMRRSGYKTGELQKMRTRLAPKKKSPSDAAPKTSPPLKTKPPVASWISKFKQRQDAIQKTADDATKRLQAEADDPDEEPDEATVEKLAELSKQAKTSTFFLRNRPHLARKILDSLTKRREAFFIPAIFAVGDSDMDLAKEQTLHHKLHCLFTQKLKNDASWNAVVRAADAGKEGKLPPQDCGDSVSSLSFSEVVELIGSPGLRETMVKAGMAWDPCIKSSAGEKDAPRESSAGQSMIFAGLAAHKALDFKCTGLNVAFGPQPRGQRIQEMGRNWRTCVNLPFVAIRQLFLDGEEEILKNDLLLDSFYQAQNEVLDWLRIITVSAGLGCSLWWGYSQWTKLLSSYHNMRPSETEWFFGKDKSPCMDAKGASSSKPSLLDWYDKEGREKHEANSFYRCNRTNLFSKMTLEDSKKDYGRIVRSAVGAFSPDEIVFDAAKNPHDVVPDPSCRMGTAVELQGNPGASTKYCLTVAEAAQLAEPAKPHAPHMKMDDLMGPLKPHDRMAIEERKKLHAAMVAHHRDTPSHPAHAPSGRETEKHASSASASDLFQHGGRPPSALELLQKPEHSPRNATVGALHLLKHTSSPSEMRQHPLGALELLRQRPEVRAAPALELLRKTPTERVDGAHPLPVFREPSSPSSTTSGSEATNADAILRKSQDLRSRIQQFMAK